MAEYKSFHPDNKVVGITAGLSAIVALGGDKVEKFAAEYGIKLDPEQVVPMQSELDLLRDLKESGGFFDMVSVGMKIPEIAKFPPGIDDVHAALSTLNDAYHMNVEGPDVGEYTYEKLDARKARLTCRNPFPSDFDYGLIYGLVKRFRPEDSEFITVIRDDSIPNRKTGADVCVYTAEW